jgi:uncharacterized protein (TIRG00374 family)
MSAQQKKASPKRSWRRRVPAPLRHGVTILLALLVIEYFVIPKFVAAKDNVALVVHAHIILLVFAVVLEAASLFTYALLTRVLLPPDAPGVGTLFRVDLAATAVAHVVPGGSAASATLGYRLFTKLGIDGRAAGFAMATQGLGSAVVLNVLLWVSLVVSIPFAGVHAIYATVAVVGMLAIIAVAALVFAFTRGEEGAVRIVRAIGRRVPRLTEARVESVVRQIGDSLRALWHDRDQLRLAIVWGVLNWLLDAACLWAFLAAFHTFVNPVELFAAYGIGNVLAVLPITPGGLGIVETTTILLLKSFGVASDVALEAVIGWRLINFWLPIPLGAGCYISLQAELGAKRISRRKALAAMAAEARPAEGRDLDAKDGNAKDVVGPITPAPLRAKDPVTALRTRHR